MSKKFSLALVTVDTVKKIKNGLLKYKSLSGDIPLNVLRSSEFTFSYLTECIDEVLRSSKFAESLKLSDIVQVYKKRIPQINLIFDQLAFCLLFKGFWKGYIWLTMQLYEQVSELLCGFWKARSTQHASFKLLQAWQKELDQCGFVGTIFMDLRKAYDYLAHDIPIAKLEAYGLDMASLSLLKSYLANLKQRTKVESSHSGWFEFIRRIPQSSILGPLLFNIFINDIFLKYKNPTFVTLQMTIHCILVAKTEKLLLKT